MSHVSAPEANGLARLLRGLERKLGAHREERSLWVWLMPAATALLTVAALMTFGTVSGVDLLLSVPMSLVMGAFMGGLSAIYLTAASADQDDAAPPPPPT